MDPHRNRFELNAIRIFVCTDKNLNKRGKSETFTQENDPSIHSFIHLFQSCANVYFEMVPTFGATWSPIAFKKRSTRKLAKNAMC